MPICPNCGSWVDEGDNICSCGASVGGSSSGTENFEYEIRELYRQAHVFQDEGDYFNAMKLYRKIIDEIDRRNLNDCGGAWFFRPKAEKEMEELRKREKF